MAEWRQAEWRKSHRRGVTSESLIGIGPNARALFWTLFTCAWWDEESPEGRLLESPDPTDAKSIEALGAMSDLTQGQARTALERLRRKHIAEVDDYGVVILPKFRKWQRGESYERQERRQERQSTHWVYFALAGDLVKIGCSANPWARVADFAQGCPGIRLVGKIRGEFADERALHERFADLRARGEWFHYTGELRDYVEGIRSTTVVDDGSSTKEADSRQQKQRTPVVPGGDIKPPALVAHVLAELTRAVQELEPGSTGPRDTPSNRERIAKATKAHTLDEAGWSLAIHRQLESVRPNRQHWKFLSLSTLCRPNNGVLERLLSAPAPSESAARPTTSTPRPTLLSIAEIRQLEAAEDARATR